MLAEDPHSPVGEHQGESQSIL